MIVYCKTVMGILMHNSERPETNSFQLPYHVVNLEQGTAEWHAWRNQGIGSSDAPVIMGENPYKTRSRLLQDKLNRVIVAPNPAMIRGTTLEPEARKRYEDVSGIAVQPLCLQSTIFNWLRASVDGLSDSGNTVVEIKCGESVYRHAATTRQVPTYYVGQLQHILAVTNLPEIDFWCYLPGQPNVRLRVGRDDRYIERLLRVEQMFWDDIQKNIRQV